jgi:uncharacterized protein (DUF934 family)
MPRLIRRAADGGFAWADDRFTTVPDEDPIPAGDVILSLTRFMAEGEALLANRRVGVRLEPSEAVEDLAYDLPRIPVVVLVWPNFRDGRALSSARLLRQRYAYQGEVRAVGEVLREQALHMVRCGFDAFEPADGSDPQTWAQAALGRYRHVYQRAADDRVPIFVERGSGE